MMNDDVRFVAIDSGAPAHVAAVAEIWNGACGADLEISERFVRFNLAELPTVQQWGRLALHEGAPVGFVVASAPTDTQDGGGITRPGWGWLDAIAVLPAHQRHGIGSALLVWAEGRLAEVGCGYAILGQSFRPFTPGLPQGLESGPFFTGRGWQENGRVWDVAANLATYRPPRTVREVTGREIAGQVRSARREDEEALLAFLWREFPDRWHTEAVEFLGSGGRASDFMLLWTDRGVDGFCRLTFEDSTQPMDRYYPYRLPKPWGQLGPIGVSADCRGRGFGAAVLDAGLRRLHNNGVNGCVIDWTDLLDFYGKFGFEPFREYTVLEKTVGDDGRLGGTGE